MDRITYKFCPRVPKFRGKTYLICALIYSAVYFYIEKYKSSMNKIEINYEIKWLKKNSP